MNKKILWNEDDFPKWTVISHTQPTGTGWVGTAWEFFDDDENANLKVLPLLKDDLISMIRRC